MVNRKIVNESMANEKKKLSHEEGVGFLTAIIALIYNFVKSLRRQKNVETAE